jgi:hypothetical protein
MMCRRGDRADVLYCMYTLSGMKDLPNEHRSQPESWVAAEETLSLCFDRLSHGSGIG